MMDSYPVSEKWSTSSCAPSTSASSSDISRRGISVKVHNFQTALKKLLPSEEQQDVAQVLKCYHRNRNAYYLAESMKTILNTSEKKALFPLLKEIIPKADRASFDQFTCEETFNRQSAVASSKQGSVYHLPTNDSGIGSNSAGPYSISRGSNYSNSISSHQPIRPPHRSSSLSNLSQRTSEKGSKRFSASSFGSAVRRKVRAALARRGSSSSIEFKSSVQKRHHSDTQINKIGVDGEFKSKHGYNKANSHNGRIARSRPVVPQGDLVCVNVRRSSNQEFGFTIGGGSEIGSGIFVSQVEPGSPAEAAGINKGDIIVGVNDTLFNAGTSHDLAIGVLSTLRSLKMFIKPGKTPTSLPNDVPWMDMHGRPASPPHSISKKNQYAKPVLDTRRSSLHLLQAGERKVNLIVKPGQSLGLMIRGGAEYGLGIYVTEVDSLSAAEYAGLKAGDEILEVNNESFEGVTHAEAVSIIKSSPILIMTVRYIGRIPQNQHAVPPRMVDDRISLESSVSSDKRNNSPLKENQNGVRATFQRKMVNNNQMILPNMHLRSPSHQSIVRISSIMSTLEEALLASSIWMNLSDSERRSLRYYVKEYATGTVSVDSLVLALSELLNNNEKFALMSAVRDCIVESDLDRFDVLVLRREVKELRNQRRSQSDSNSISTNRTKSSSESTDLSGLQSSSSSALHLDELDATPRVSPPDLPHQHSTPKECSVNSQCSTPRSRRSFSPIRPSQDPPPPPPPLFKTPPIKPKRTSSLNKTPVSDGKTENPSNTSPHNPSNEAVYSVIDKKQTKDDRPTSPFSIALEKHRSSNSGRIKTGTKSTHPALPDSSFFKDPNYNPSNDLKSKPISSGLIKPIKNPSIKLIKKKKKQPLEDSFKVNSHDTTPDNPYPSSSATSSSSSLSEYGSLHPTPPQKMTLRPAMFACSVNDKIKSSYRHPVRADVHPHPSRNLVNDGDLHSTEETASQLHNHVKNDDGDGSNSSDADEPLPPCMADNVETQKVVIFRRAAALGLVIEGGAGTKQPLPRVLKVQPGSCASFSGRVNPGHVIHEVNGKPLEGLTHSDAVRAIALAFKLPDRDSIELVLSGPYG